MAFSRDPATQRRVAALSALAAAAAGLGIAVGSVGGDEGGEAQRRAAPAPAPASPQEPVDRLSLEQQVGQLLLMSFDETEPPDYIARRLRRERGAGVVLFAKNTLDPESAATLTQEIQRAAGGDALVAADQEGGTIRSVPGAEPDQAQASIDTPDEADVSAAAGAADLQEAGVNVNLAPVADVAADSASVMLGRAYPGEVDDVAALVDERKCDRGPGRCRQLLLGPLQRLAARIRAEAVRADLCVREAAGMQPGEDLGAGRLV